MPVLDLTFVVKSIRRLVTGDKNQNVNFKMLDDTGLGALDGVFGTFSNEGSYQIAPSAPDSDEGEFLFS